MFDYKHLDFFDEMINIVEKKIKMILSKKYWKFVDVFNKQNADKLSQHNRFNHAIKIKKIKKIFRIYLQFVNDKIKNFQKIY